MKIITNNQPRPLFGWDDLTDKERKEFDHWLETEEKQYSATFFRYKGQVWCTGEFVRTPSTGDLSDWDGLYASSAFSGVLIKIIHGLGDEVIVGSCYN